MMKPSFPDQISLTVVNHLTGARYSLRRIDSIEETEAVLESIVSICNQGKIYSWLFEALLHGRPYERTDAQRSFETGREGWESGETFVFLLLAEDGLPAGCVKIGAADLENGEVGYWASAEHRGVMTNAVRGLAVLAGEAGYRKLFGRTRKGNVDSSRLLSRVDSVSIPDDQ